MGDNLPLPWKWIAIKEQIQTKIASYLQILYFLKCHSATRVKALINSQNLFSSRGTPEGLDCQSQACTAAMRSHGACALLCALGMPFANGVSKAQLRYELHVRQPSSYSSASERDISKVATSSLLRISMSLKKCSLLPRPLPLLPPYPPTPPLFFSPFLQAHCPHGLKLTVTFSRWLQISRDLWQILRGRIQFSNFLCFSFLFLLSFFLLFFLFHFPSFFFIFFFLQISQR